MKIVFAGTPEFSLPSLQALIEAKHDVIAVYTQPDRPKGRGRQLQECPVKVLAKAHQLPLYQPHSLKQADPQEQLALLKPDLMVVVAYGLLLPKKVLNIPKYGCINVHASLLPKFRGASPIQQAVLAGETKTGITIMQMDEGLDTGDILSTVSCDIKPFDNTKILHDRLSSLGNDALLSVIDALELGKIQITPQDNHLASYAPKIEKTQGLIDWKESVDMIDRKIRAYHSWPVAYTHYDTQTVRIWGAEILSLEKSIGTPGEILEVSKEGIDVATGLGTLRINRLQLPGGKVLNFSEMVNAKPHYFSKGHSFSL